MSRNWLAVASAEHVRRGRAAGFMQICHGKAAPLRRLQPGDGVAYYSPTEAFRGKDRLQPSPRSVSSRPASRTASIWAAVSLRSAAA